MRRRKNSEEERRKTFIAIEMISSTKTARERGLGAKFGQIKEYTGLTRVATDAALRALERHGLIANKSGMQWFIKKQIPDAYCFKHGLVPFFCGRCAKCISETGKLEESD